VLVGRKSCGRWWAAVSVQCDRVDESEVSTRHFGIIATPSLPQVGRILFVVIRVWLSDFSLWVRLPSAQLLPTIEQVGKMQVTPSG